VKKLTSVIDLVWDNRDDLVRSASLTKELPTSSAPSLAGSPTPARRREPRPWP